mgnify:FL=1
MDIRQARHPAENLRYYRVEILAALANAVVLLFLMAFFILFEAYRRFREPREIDSLQMLAVAAVGLAVNLIGIAVLTFGSGLGHPGLTRTHQTSGGSSVGFGYEARWLRSGGSSGG